MANAADDVAGARPAPCATRRDFLYVATGVAAAAGGALAVWPLIDSMNPSADLIALASIEVDIEPFALGQRVTITWRKQPVFIVRRTAAEITRARADDGAELIDPEPDEARVQRPEWLIVVGVCTHLGCIPLGQRGRDRRGDWNGWFCPCHGSHYDTSGRIRKGPAPRNLEIPPYEFSGDLVVRIG